MVKRILKGKNPYLIIVAIGFLLYCRSLLFGFTYLDDNVLILDNINFLKDISNVLATFKQDVFHVLHSSAAYYRPVLVISFLLDAQLAGVEPFFYHLTNILIHLIASCLVYKFLVTLKYKRDLSFLLAIVFTVHPVLSQAVAWLPGRNDSLLLVFVLATFIKFIDYLDNGKSISFILSVFFFGLAVFTKESALLLPALMIVYYIAEKKRWQFNRLFSGLFALLIVVFLWFVMRYLALAGDSIPYQFPQIIKSLLTNYPASLLFLGKIFLPVNLTVLPVLIDSTLIYGVISLVGLLLIVILSKKKNWAMMSFGFIWFAVFLVPSFIRPNPDYISDFIEHRLYVPIMGVFIILLETGLVRNLDFKKVVHKAAILIIILTLSVITFVNLGHFKDKISFWQEAVAGSPSHPLSHKNLGAMYYLDGDLDNSEREYLIAVSLEPEEKMIYNNLGLIYYDRRDYNMAEEYYLKELIINPLYDKVHYNLGLLYQVTDREDEAKEMFLKTIFINPDYINAYKQLINYYLLRDQKEEVNFYYQELIKRGVQI